MIVICDLLCKGMSHEKVNSGFLYGLRLAFPEEKIVFYADATHIASIKSILHHDQIAIDQIEYRPTHIRQHSSLFDVAGFYFGLKKLFTEIIGLGADKVFFLSFNTEALYAI
jgi:hypothetical protein